MTSNSFNWGQSQAVLLRGPLGVPPSAGHQATPRSTNAICFLAERTLLNRPSGGIPFVLDAAVQPLENSRDIVLS